MDLGMQNSLGTVALHHSPDVFSASPIVLGIFFWGPPMAENMAIGSSRVELLQLSVKGGEERVFFSVGYIILDGNPNRCDVAHSSN